MPAVESARALPWLIAHADWSSNPKKRRMCLGMLGSEGRYRVHAPTPVGRPSALLHRLARKAPGQTVLVGVDVPIGLPAAFARQVGVHRFIDVLPELGSGRWSDFYDPADSPDEISLTRPFYPRTPGGTKQSHLIEALGVDDMDALRRRCEWSTDARGAAASLFWTLGGQQVGKAAISWWRTVLAPALRGVDTPASIWPFDGSLEELLRQGGIVIAESYPAEACVHLGLTPPGRGWSKRSQADRQAKGVTIREWCEGRSVVLSEGAAARIDDGFGPGPGADDDFDALIGLLSMIDVVAGRRPTGAPMSPDVRDVEGWILGLVEG